MNRRNVNPEYKFGDTDGFQLTDIDTDESLMLIPCDTAGNFSWTGVTRAPLQRNAMQTSTTNNQYSDLEKPWISIPQEDWTGGRANDIFTKDTTRYRDGKRCQTSFNQVVYNAPLEYYSKGFRKAETNCPGNLKWHKVTGSLAVSFTPKETFEAGELYIHLRRHGDPETGLTVKLVDSLSSDAETLAEHTYTIEEITDVISEFKKFIFDGVTLTEEQTYYIVVSSSGNYNHYWQVGVATNAIGYDQNSNAVNYQLYYRIAEAQEGYRARFFLYEQLQWMIRQKPNGTPTLWMNGDIGLASSADADTITSTGKTWKVNQWQGARIGLVYRNGIEGQVSVWRTITENSADTITIDSPWDVTPQEGTAFIIVDTPIWTEVTGHGLTSTVTDVHVVRGTVYFCQGDYAPIIKMRWNINTGAFEWFSMTDVYASFLQSVRDTSGMMLYRARNDDTQHRRSIERAVLVDWEDAWDYPTFSTDVDYKESDFIRCDKQYQVKVWDPEQENYVWESRWSNPSDHSNQIYQFTEDHSAAGNWTGRDVSPANVIPETGDYIPPDVPEGKVVAEITSAITVSGGTEFTLPVDFGTYDFDKRQYVIDVCKFSSTKNTGRLTITLQESENGFAFTDVSSITITGAGRWYLTAHCQFPYRRLSLTATGTNTSVNQISVRTTNKLHFEDPITLLDNYGKITRLFEYGAEQSKSLWVIQEGMLSSINKVDGAIDTYTHDRINIDELSTTAEEWNGQAMNTADVYLLWGWLNGLQRYYNTQLEGKGPDHDEGLPFDRQGRVTQIVSYPSNVFISIAGDDGYSCVMQFNQSGWAELYRSPNTDEPIYDMAFQPIYGTRPDRLWVQVGDDVVWLAMPSKILYALQDKNAEYTHESVIISAWHTAGMIDIEKLWQSLKVMADYLDGKNCWIEADYQVDEEEVWHPIENYYVVSPSQKEELSKRSVNGKKLRYRLRLQTSDIHKTPKVNAVVLEAVGRVDIKQSYTFYFRNIKYKRDLNGEFEDIEPLEVQNLLDDWANRLKKLRLNSRWLIYDNKIVYLDGVQTSVLNELSEGYIAQISLNEL